MKKRIIKFNKIPYVELDTVSLTNADYSGTEFVDMLKSKCDDLNKLHLEFTLESDSYYDECSHSLVLYIYRKVEENA